MNRSVLARQMFANGGEAKPQGMTESDLRNIAASRGISLEELLRILGGTALRENSRLSSAEMQNIARLLPSETMFTSPSMTDAKNSALLNAIKDYGMSAMEFNRLPQSEQEFLTGMIPSTTDRIYRAPSETSGPAGDPDIYISPRPMEGPAGDPDIYISPKN